MSPESGASRITARSQIVLLIGLVLLWCLVWGQFSLLTVVSGVALAVIISLVFYLPAIDLSGRINIWRTIVFFLRLIVDIIGASLNVAWLVIDPRYKPSSAILAIALDTRSDIIMMFTAEAISLVPGSIVVDIDREESVLYVHVINVKTDEDLEKLRSSVFATEKRLVMGIGSKDDVWRVQQPNELTRSSVRRK
ncbi:Na+/H+ antiporter subunit E [Mycetocola manganoxydans]|uniref:Na+/H+ antiporter subunit E n=1 Tax=Mycetocola manganoxydans TaxID=699879 RepID=A0A3L6ZVP9_9MICO|nr:Na+/H+ antiporter subunit E [Mycetocola manganoxydans]RLP72073.1 Na+/H+ antiporter subunit E [Mycetocola manganoxydans]GHD47821.1 sodium:proton antiporter [Mycetocola manganoxydans]